jgi:SNF2 family DNA or RNA helicase
MNLCMNQKILNKSDLEEYQLKAINYILNKKRCGLGLKPGLGKTICTLTAFSEIIGKKVKKLLVIAPLTIAKNVWINEMDKWSHTRDFRVSICCGNEKIRLAGLNAEADIYVINQENVEWMYDQGFSKYGMIVVDESHEFKGSDSYRFNALKNFKSIYMVLLSGTPAPSGFIDFWSQQYLIDKGKMFGDTITGFRNHYFREKKNGHGYECIYPKLIMNKLKRNWLFMDSKDYLDLPDKMMITTPVIIDNYQEYKSFEDDFYLKIQEMEVTAVNAGVLCNKLIQYCNGAVYDQDRNVIIVHNNKLDMLDEIMKQHTEDNFLVAYNFKSDEDRIKKRFPHAVTMNAKDVNQLEPLWNEGKIKMMLCQCNSGRGLNIQKGGRIIIWFGLTFRLDSYIQFNDRLHRRGQDKPVIIYHLVGKDCKDERVMQIIGHKDLTQEELFEVLKNKDD